MTSALQLKLIVRDVISLLLGQLRDVPHSKNDFWTHLMNLKFYEHLLVKDQ